MNPSPRALAAWLLALSFLAFALLARTAAAHAMGLSRGDYTLAGDSIAAEIVVRTEEARGLAPEQLFQMLDVFADGERCTSQFDSAVSDPPDGTRMRATYTCSHAPSHLHLVFGFVQRMPPGHEHMAILHLPGREVDALATEDHPDMELDIEGGESRGFGSLLRAGVEHILTGADHLAFLLALVLGGTMVEDRRGRVWALVAMLTAFTVGHTLSLAIATLGGFAPGARLVEPAVALSVAYVGAENLWTHDVAHRWKLTLPFGFIHGFAFAGGLLPLGMPRDELPGALFAFNLGVETGQLAVLAVALTPLLLVRSRKWYPWTARILSAAIAVAGIAWFVKRIG